MSDDSQYIDQVFRIEELKQELETVTRGEMHMECSAELTPDIEEQFLEQVLAFENADEVTHKTLLARDGVALPAPEEMSDDELGLKLIEIIQSLAVRRTYLENTNHLSDRALYALLVDDVLNETTPDLPPGHPMNCHIDLVGSGSEEHVRLYLRYYADETSRASWAKDFADLDIPPHEDPPYDRDRNMPQPPPPTNPYDDPEVVAVFWQECRAKLEKKLVADAIVHGAINDEPISYAPGLACVYAVDAPNAPGTTGWWAISGDLPTTYRPAADIPDPRTFMRVLSRYWQDAADAMENGNPPAEMTIGTSKDWPTIIPMLRWRAELLTDWADDEEAWEDACG